MDAEDVEVEGFFESRVLSGRSKKKKQELQKKVEITGKTEKKTTFHSKKLLQLLPLAERSNAVDDKFLYSLSLE